MSFDLQGNQPAAPANGVGDHGGAAAGKTPLSGGRGGGAGAAGGTAGAGLYADAPVPSMAPAGEDAGGGDGGGADPFDFSFVEEAGGGEGGESEGGESADAEDAKASEEIQRVASAGVSGGGGALPHLEKVQASFGAEHDLSGVDAHVGGQAAEAADTLGAEAFATGNSVAFGEQPDLHTAAHEAAHVVQQRAGVSFKRGIGASDDAHERQADAVADRVVAGQSAADLLPAPAAGAATTRAPVQRRLSVAGAVLDAAGATRAGNGLVTTELRALVTERPARAALIRETVRELQATSDLHAFPTQSALANNVRQRVLTSQYMRRSQGTTQSNMAFSYPNSRNDGTVGVGPKVNDAAVSYWGAAYGSPYRFDLTPAGKANAYQALMTLFVEHTVARRRSLIHCDYVVSVIRLRAYAESIGTTEFNRLVSSNALPLQLRYDMFAVMENAQGAGGRTAPLTTVTVASESDLIVGDHVVFWNHPSYDPLIAGTSGVWRLENAIVIDKQGGELRYQGHGYFSPVNKAHLIRGMLHNYNIHIDDALGITRRIDTGPAAARTAAQTELSTRFPRVFRRAAGGWEIRGTGFGSVPTVRELKHLTAAEAPALVSPLTGTIQARRPVETDL